MIACFYDLIRVYLFNHLISEAQYQICYRGEVKHKTENFSRALPTTQEDTQTKRFHCLFSPPHKEASISSFPWASNMPDCRIVKNLDFGFTYYSCGTTLKNIYNFTEQLYCTLLQCLLYPIYTLPALNAQLGLSPLPWEDGCLETTITLRFSEKLLDVKEHTSSTG